jgi:hypothetical protein
MSLCLHFQFKFRMRRFMHILFDFIFVSFFLMLKILLPKNLAQAEC